MLRPPVVVPMAMGEALHAEDVGCLFWNDQIALRKLETIDRWILLGLPETHQNLSVCLDMYFYIHRGHIVRSGRRFNGDVDRFYAEQGPPYQKDREEFRKMLITVLTDQPRWAIWVLRDCDDAEPVFIHEVTEAADAVAAIFDPRSPEANGFRSVSVISR